MEIFWELRQNRRIDAATQDAQRARQKSDQSGYRLDELQRRVDRLALASQALWELLREQTDLTDDQVMARMVDIDLRDGKRDGKIGRSVTACPACDRPANSSRTQCLYCGEELRPAHLFD